MGFRQATGLTDLSEDIVQESLMRLWELVQKGYPVRDFEALAMKITKNLCVDRLRKRRLKPHQIESVIVNKIDGTIRVFLKKG